jgi:hypothetical protein
VVETETRKTGTRSEKIQPVNALLGLAMPSQYGVRVKLDRAAAEWSCVVGELLARQSAPVDVADKELLVVAETPLVANRLSMMAGNIARTLLERWRFEVEKVKVVVGRPPLKSQGRTGQAGSFPAPVRVKEEDVKALVRNYLEASPDLPEDVVESFARLQAFFATRFGRN